MDHTRGGRRRWCSDDTCGPHDRRVRRFRSENRQ
ncbi:CGNR zinc finger domain-containing protein [Phyllobacterium zundukense]|uniref:CGNR zinc finger domain-containing protein n=1 Tax=Phyllobacterium zundukense TaxID=1867719 RepID=A0ACD4D072_9HYPH|nr:CGNR zinc finger domain-containing protein [Phyllobacterium zundukense]UXN59209.1 CGNR zinc finger domain-containing protein [Phyllobacterium zundukense]